MKDCFKNDCSSTMPAVLDPDNGKVCAHIYEKDDLYNEYNCEDYHFFVPLIAQIIVVVKNVHIQQYKREYQVTDIKRPIVIRIAKIPGPF